MAKKPTGKAEQDPLHKIEERDGMMVEWDVPIPMPDGIILRADVFRPIKDGKYPVIISHGPYAKGLAFQDTFKSKIGRAHV